MFASLLREGEEADSAFSIQCLSQSYNTGLVEILSWLHHLKYELLYLHGLISSHAMGEIMV